MNAKEYSDQFPFDGDVQSGFVIMSETDLIQVMEEYANHYHQEQVKNNVDLGSVRLCFPTDEDIEDIAESTIEESGDNNDVGYLERARFKDGAKWAIEMIKNSKKWE